MGENRGKKDPLLNHRIFFSQPTGRDGNDDRSLNSGVIGKRTSKNELYPRTDLCHTLKPQFHKAISRELQKLRMKNLILLKEGDSIRV